MGLVSRLTLHGSGRDGPMWLCPACLPHTSFPPSLLLSLSVLLSPSTQVCPSVVVGPSLSCLGLPFLFFSGSPPSTPCRDLKESVVSHCYFCLQPHSPGAGQVFLHLDHTPRPITSPLHVSHASSPARRISLRRGGGWGWGELQQRREGWAEERPIRQHGAKRAPRDGKWC